MNRCCINLFTVSSVLCNMPHTHTHTLLPPLGDEVCCNRIGIPPQTQPSGVNIYRGDWHEAIRSRGPFMITQGNLYRIFNQELVCISGTKTFESVLKAFATAFWQRSRRNWTNLFSAWSRVLFRDCFHWAVLFTDKKHGALAVPQCSAIWLPAEYKVI